MTQDKDHPEDIPAARTTAVDPREAKAKNTRFDVQAEAQRSKMANAEQPPNPNRVPRTNQPNAGGRNRDVGDRKGRGATEMEN